MSTIGQRIKARREELGLTQKELAEKVGYTSKAAIGKIETDVNQLRQDKIKPMADALYTSVAYIMGWEEETKNNDAMADIIIKMRSDDNFFQLVNELSNLNGDQIEGVRQLLHAFLK